jgi:hypothetical protein
MSVKSLGDLIKTSSKNKETELKKAEKEETFDTELKERAICKYDKKTLESIKREKTIVLTQIETLEEEGASIFSNQLAAAKTITKNFKDQQVVMQMVIGRCQSGKTGTMLGVIKQYLSDASNQIPASNIFLITGLSSVEWVEQTKARMPKEIAERVFHRAELTKGFADAMKGLSNVLIIIDETHIAKLEKQTICAAFKKIGLLNLQYLLHKDIKIVEFTATPNTVIYNISQWGDYSKVVFVESGKGYIGCGDLLKMGKVKQYLDLTGGKKLAKVKKSVDTNVELEEKTKVETKKTSTKGKKKIDKKGSTSDDPVMDNLAELKATIDNFKQPRYHIVRTDTGKNQEIVIKNFNKVFNGNYVLVSYDENNKIDINAILVKKPVSHVIIFIKEMLRCAKTLHKEFIGVLYERYTKAPNEDNIIQGLIGRLCGYGYNGSSIVYTDIASIESYEKRYAEGFAITSDKKDKKFKTKATFNDPKLIVGMKVKSTDVDIDGASVEAVVNRVGEHKIFTTQAELMEFYKANIKTKYGDKAKGVLIRAKEPAKDKFYYELVGGKKTIVSVADAIQMGLADINAKKGNKLCRYLVGYESVDKQDSVKFILVFRK